MRILIVYILKIYFMMTAKVNLRIISHFGRNKWLGPFYLNDTLLRSSFLKTDIKRQLSILVLNIVLCYKKAFQFSCIIFKITLSTKGL